jgi:signal transduction histidine kinase
VEDDGPGVTDDERERIFEPGVRGVAADTNGARGSGLGLSLARRLARSVAGDVEAAGGTRFVVRLRRFLGHLLGLLLTFHAPSVAEAAASREG